jgi:hypothetical protein
MLKITRVSDVQFSVVTDTALSDGTYKQDSDVRFRPSNPTELHSYEQRGHIRTGSLISIKLGPKSLALVRALKIGETVELGQK